MDVSHRTELFEQAADAARRVSGQDDYEAVFAPLVAVADHAPEAIDSAFAKMDRRR